MKRLEIDFALKFFLIHQKFKTIYRSLVCFYETSLTKSFKGRQPLHPCHYVGSIRQLSVVDSFDFFFLLIDSPKIKRPKTFKLNQKCNEKCGVKSSVRISVHIFMRKLGYVNRQIDFRYFPIRNKSIVVFLDMSTYTVNTVLFAHTLTSFRRRVFLKN